MIGAVLMRAQHAEPGEAIGGFRRRPVREREVHDLDHVEKPQRAFHEKGGDQGGEQGEGGAHGRIRGFGQTGKICDAVRLQPGAASAIGGVQRLGARVVLERDAEEGKTAQGGFDGALIVGLERMGDGFEAKHVRLVDGTRRVREQGVGRTQGVLDPRLGKEPVAMEPFHLEDQRLLVDAPGGIDQVAGKPDVAEGLSRRARMARAPGRMAQHPHEGQPLAL